MLLQARAEARPRARRSVRLVGIGAAARALGNAQPGRVGVTPAHLRAVCLGERRSDRLLAEVRERFPGLLAPGGATWREWLAEQERAEAAADAARGDAAQ